MIVITGASGKLGGSIVDNLLSLVPAARIVATGRDVSKLSHLSDKGVGLRTIDFKEPSTLRAAFEGASKILIISAPIMGPEAEEANRRVANAAAESGAARVYYTSHVGAREITSFGPGELHWKMEQNLRNAGATFTSLRNGFYATSLHWLIGGFSKMNSIVVPADGKSAWVGHEDLARATAKILVAPIEEDQPQIINLTGPKAYTMRELAEYLSKHSGKPCDFKLLSDQDFLDYKIQNGTPEQYAKMSLGFFKALGSGIFETVTDDIEKATGKTPKSLEELIEDGDIVIQ